MHVPLRASVLVPRISACLLVVVLLLVGCGGGSSDEDASSGGGSGPPPSGPADHPGGAGATGSSAADCHNPSLYQTGTKWEEQWTTIWTGTGQRRSVVDGAAIFPPTNQPSIKIVRNTTDAVGNTGAAEEYVNVVVGPHILHYGVVDFTFGVTVTGVNDPFDFYRADLLPGESYVHQFTRTTRRETTVVSFEQFERTTTYVGRETVSVPAGTFETCRFDSSVNYVLQILPGPPQQTVLSSKDWIGVGNGLGIKGEAGTGAATVVTVLDSASINGVTVSGR
jgi:hypothetical protein